ncbi:MULTISPECIES: hypothetical protein [Rhodanobacter]|uniref:Nuclear transport factor 2 family protein n=3 Tax=Rhodanobacter denitrificans TaxID=666685 RepID=M4ND60_9GAMM|nr:MULTISPECIES: hypothetical protein [Rhodanobacter]AGG88670.1 hypothetical protein R2APBS1_1527 [Rhodanobacter denitrificans]KZC20546.1 hypothetical protein RHOFW104R3_25090 [Rhodanobacter denitrificans]UJJ52551.1 hypothetical protein LRK52_07660 [Rhodanobacter denitrificans]UJM89122.1 hypothetical protein LRK24_11780 [Rhodanobacter denitrificans]UJM95305.1 hypothetical protein LRK32_07700 [Rhodanobacter denitrificans]
MMTPGKTVFLPIVLACLVLGLPACRRTPDEAQVRAAIASAAQAAEAGSAGDVGARLSEDFDGNAGQLDRRGLTGMIRLLALRGEHVGVSMGPVSIEPRGERMVATFTVTLTSGGRLLPDQLGLYQVESAWRKEDGEWRCYMASWKHSL